MCGAFLDLESNKPTVKHVLRQLRTIDYGLGNGQYKSIIVTFVTFINGALVV